MAAPRWLPVLVPSLIRNDPSAIVKDYVIAWCYQTPFCLRSFHSVATLKGIWILPINSIWRQNDVEQRHWLCQSSYALILSCLLLLCVILVALPWAVLKLQRGASKAPLPGRSKQKKSPVWIRFFEPSSTSKYVSKYLNKLITLRIHDRINDRINDTGKRVKSNQSSPGTQLHLKKLATE